MGSSQSPGSNKILLSRNLKHEGQQVNKLYEINKDTPLIDEEFYQVYKAWSLNDDKLDYVVKAIKKSNLTDLQIQNIMNEVEILRKLDHPNIVTYFDLFEDDEYLGIVMSKVNGHSLEDILEKEFLQFKESEVAFIVHQLINAVYYLHAQDEMHSNIRPCNIIVDETRFSAFTDFKLSTILRQKEKGRKISSIFMAPEVYKGKTSPESDVWALGVLLYYMLSRLLPFENYTQKLAKDEQLEIEFDYKVWNMISPKAKDLVSKMLEVDPEKRLSADEARRHPWFDILKDTPPITESFNHLKNILKEMSHFEWNKFKMMLYEMLVTTLPQQEKNEFKLQFNQLDRDRDGKISFTELKQAFNKVGVKIFDAQLNNILSEIGHSHPNYITFDEFMVVLVGK